MDSLLGLSFICLGVAGFIVSVRRTGDVLHPLGLFVGGWLGVFGFAHLNVPRTFDEPYYAEPFGPLTYAVVLAALASFAIGFWLADPAFERVDRQDIARRLERGVSTPALRWLTLAFLAVATLTTAYFVRAAGDIPLFSPRIDTLRQTFKLPLLGYLYDLHYAVALFGTILFVRARSRTARLAWAAVIGIAILQLAFGGVRVSPMTAMAWMVVYLFYRVRRVGVSQMILVSALAVTMFSVIEVRRRTMFTENPALTNPRVDLSAGATAWAHTAASFKNLQYTLQRHVSPLNMGLNSYDLPKTVYPAARSVDDDISYIYGTHNTPTFLAFLYFDFGVAGLLVMPGVYGALVAVVYRRFRRHANLFWLVLHIDMVLAVLLAFRTHRFLSNNFIFFFGVALMSQLLVARRLGDPVGDRDARAPVPVAA